MRELNAASNLRRRRKSDDQVPHVASPSKTDEYPGILKGKVPPAAPRPRSKFSPTASVGCWTVLLCLALSIGMLWATYAFSRNRVHSEHRWPNAAARKPFNTRNAMRHIHHIGARPRWVGTHATEEAIQYIFSELGQMRQVARENDMELDLEIFRSGSGTFTTDVLNIELINTYSNLSSVVARLRPSTLPYDTTESALLINAHIDSAVGAIGANDNVCGAGVNMELLRTIASLPKHVDALQRPIVFLFNSAEEPVLPGAHSFISQHKWAKPIAAHINMEAIGSGDAYHLFRLGPHSPWLAKVYADAVSVPLASVASTDMFDAKLIPGETDFRIFSEFGKIPGFDFVLLDNAYIYHTMYDNLDHVDAVGIRHGGITTFELTMALAGRKDAIGAHLASSETASKNKGLSVLSWFAKDPRHPRAVFFDILHMKTIVYGEGLSVLFNIFTLLVTIAIWFNKLLRMKSDKVLAYVRMCIALVASFFGTIAGATFASFLYTAAFQMQLRWYGDWVVAACLYGPACLFGTASALLLVLPRRLSMHRFEQMLFALSLSNFFMTALLTKVGFMTAYVPAILLWVCNFCALQGDSGHQPVLKHFQLMISHSILLTRLMMSTLSVLLSILGRMRSTKVPHEAIGALITTYTIWTTVLLPSLPLLCFYANGLRKVRAVAFLLAVVVAVWLKFSDSNTSQTPYSVHAPKRISVIHFHSPQQSPQSSLLLGSQDPNPMDIGRIMSGRVPDLDSSSSSFMNTWGSLQSSSLETFRPFENFLQHWAFFDVEDAPKLSLPSVTVVSEKRVLEGGWNLTVRIDTVDSHQLTVRIPTGVSSPVKGWSVNADLQDRKNGAWIRHVGTSDLEFWLWLADPGDLSRRPEIVLAVTSGRLGSSRSSVLQKLRFEEWESPTMIVSTGQEFVL